MKLQKTEILQILNKNLEINIGRHLYAVLGTYLEIDNFINNDLQIAKRSNGECFPQPVSINNTLLHDLQPGELDHLIEKESKRPKNIQNRLNQALENCLRSIFDQTKFVIFHQFELMFAYDLDLSKFRRWASNGNHILALLPGEMRGNQMHLFHEAASENIIRFDNQLFADNNVWELKNE